MYKCLKCGNTEKFYGTAREKGNALIFQNCGKSKSQDQISEPAGSNKISIDKDYLDTIDDTFVTSIGTDSGFVIRGNLWAIQNNDKGDGISWAYIMSDKAWKGFHEVRSCAVCKSTNIVNV